MAAELVTIKYDGRTIAAISGERIILKTAETQFKDNIIIEAADAKLNVKIYDRTVVVEQMEAE